MLPKIGRSNLHTLSSLYTKLDETLKKKIDDSINDNTNGSCLLRLLKVANKTDMMTFVMDLILSKYDDENNVFVINNSVLNVTLQDIIYLTGLPIWGKPVVTDKSRDMMAFKDVLGIDEEKNSMTTLELMVIVKDTTKSLEQRLIAVLLMIISCMIIPSDDRMISSPYVEFVKDLTQANSYAWGAALLAYLYRGLKAWKSKKKAFVGGNFWVVFCFFLIRIPSLAAAISVTFERDSLEVPFLMTIVDAVRSVSHNHYLNHGGRCSDRIESILDNLSLDDIVWSPYQSTTVLPPPLCDQISYGTLVDPIFCLNHVVHHNPHAVERQFTEEFQGYMLNSFDWKPNKIKEKQNRGSHNQNFKKFFKKEIKLWNQGKIATDYMKRIGELRRCRTRIGGGRRCRRSVRAADDGRGDADLAVHIPAHASGDDEGATANDLGGDDEGATANDLGGNDEGATAHNLGGDDEDAIDHDLGGDDEDATEHYLGGDDEGATANRCTIC